MTEDHQGDSVSISQWSAYVEKPSVKWDDVFGLEEAKTALAEVLLLPVEAETLVRHGQRQPVHCILLYGPAGNGKSHIAKAVASQMDNASFICVSFYEILSKFYQEDRSLDTLFCTAVSQKPCVLLLDDLDVLCKEKDDTMDDVYWQKVQDVTTQLLSILNKESDDVVLLCATFRPWHLQGTILEKIRMQIHIGLPNAQARKAFLKKEMSAVDHSLTDEQFDELCMKTEGFSMSDIIVMVKDATMLPLRTLAAATHFRKVEGFLTNTGNERLTPCSSDTPGAIAMDWTQISEDQYWQPPLTMVDMLESLSGMKPSIPADELKKFDDFKENRKSGDAVNK